MFPHWSIGSCRLRSCVEKFSQFIPFCFGGKIFCELSLPIFPTIFGISLFVPLHIILSSLVSGGVGGNGDDVVDSLLFTILLLLFKLLSLSFLLVETSVIESLMFVDALHELVRFCTFCANCSHFSLFSKTPFTSGCNLSESFPKA